MTRISQLVMLIIMAYYSKGCRVSSTKGKDTVGKAMKKTVASFLPVRSHRIYVIPAMVCGRWKGSPIVDTFLSLVVQGVYWTLVT